MFPKSRKTTLCVIATAVVLSLAGCGEDRSNLLPPDTAERIDSNLDQVRSLVREGNCFEALAAAEEVRSEVEALGSGVDDTLRRNLIDGVTELQIMVQDNCVEADTDPVEPVTPEPVPEEVPVPEEESTGSTGDTGSAGTTDGGDTQPDPAPEPQPQPEPQPDTPPDDGSGGVGPSTGGARP